MILDGFCVIQSPDELSGGAQRQAVTPNDWDLQSGREVPLIVFPDCLCILPRVCSHLQ